MPRLVLIGKPLISALLFRAIVDRSGWSSGNLLAIIISGNDWPGNGRRRTAKSFDGDAAGASVLHVEYQ